MTNATPISPFRPGDRVLVACGDHALAEALARSFAATGYAVRIAFDGVAALDKARAFFPTAAVLALDLRYLDSFQLARALRTIPGCARVRLVAVLPPAVALLDRQHHFDYELRAAQCTTDVRPLWFDGASMSVRPTAAR